MDIIEIENKSEMQNLDREIYSTEAGLRDLEHTIAYKKRMAHSRFRNYLEDKRFFVVWTRIASKCPEEAKFICRKQYSMTIEEHLREFKARIDFARSEYRLIQSRLKEVNNPERLRDLKQQLALKKQKKARLIATGLPKIQINITKIKNKISQMTGVDEVEFKDQSPNHYRLSVSLSGLVMSPSSDRTLTLQRLQRNVGKSEDKALDIPLADCKFDIWFNKNDMSQYHFSMASDVNISAYERSFLPHPHWISENNPCLGDFAGGITEAMLTGDLETAATLLIIYLGQYNSDDPAGGYFYRWWMYNDDPHSVQISAPFDYDSSEEPEICHDCENYLEDCACE